MDPRRRALKSRLPQTAAGALTLAISAASLLGWAVPSPFPLQLRADWVRVPPNTAVALIFVGIAILVAQRGPMRLAAGFGIAAATVAGITLIQGAVEIDFQLADVLARAWPATRATDPGTVGADSAIGIMLIATATCLMRSRFRVAVAVCSIGAWALGLGALLYRMTGLSATHGWGTRTPMAPAVALCLLVLGSALLWDRGSAVRHGLRRTWFGPLVAGLGSIAITFLIFDALFDGQQRQIDATIKATTQRIRSEIRIAIQAQRDALAGLAREWDDTFFRRRSAWESDARIAFAKSQGMYLIAWYESSGDLNWSYPPTVDVPPIELPAPSATAKNVLPRIHAVTLPDGSTGFALLAPILDSEAVDGWLRGVFSAREFFRALSTVLPEGYGIRVTSDQATIYDDGFSEGVPPHWFRSVSLDLESGVTVTVRPTANWLEQQRSYLPQVILASGVLVSGLLVWALRAAQLSAARAVALEGALTAHQGAANEIRRLNLELEARVSQRTAELQQTNEELKQFAAFLSHELRQPVAALGLWAELLGTEYVESLDEQGRDYISRIGQSAGRIGHLIDAQLSLSKITSAPIQLGSVDLNAIVDEVASDLASSLDQNRAVVKQEKLPSVMGDGRQLYQLFRNLIENSIRYRRPEAPIEVWISGQRNSTGVTILYEDNGRGFDSADAEKIFTAFERANDSDAEGLGLGLALCRRIMERCGGSIVAHGNQGRGAAFRIRFPPLE